MISSNQLTKENGFEDGVVVYAEFDTYPANSIKYLVGKWEHIKDKFENGTQDFWMALMSVKPITGPMAIWNYAPEWAEYCFKSGFNITWLLNDDKYKSWKGLPDFYSLIKRPFWAKETK